MALSWRRNLYKLALSSKPAPFSMRLYILCVCPPLPWPISLIASELLMRQGFQHFVNLRCWLARHILLPYLPRWVNSSRYIKWLGSCILQFSAEDEIEIKGVLAAIEKDERRFTIQKEEEYLTRCQRKSQILLWLVKSGKMHDLMNSKSEWNHVRILRTVVNQ